MNDSPMNGQDLYGGEVIVKVRAKTCWQHTVLEVTAAAVVFVHVAAASP